MIKTKKTINNNGTCTYCKTKSIHYSILNGSYIYECLKCDKAINKDEIIINRDYSYLKNSYMQDEMSKIFKKYQVFFAFSDKQFNEGLEKEGISKNEKLSSISGGGFVPKKNAKAFLNDFEGLHNNLVKEVKKLNKADVIEYELGNYECYYTGDITDALEVLTDYDFTKEDVSKVYHATKSKHYND